MNFSTRVSIEDRPLFEAVVTRLLVTGVIVGGLLAPLWRESVAAWPTALGLVTVVALLGASSFLGRDDTTLGRRLGGLLAAVVIGVCFGSVAVGVVAVGASTGVAMAGGREGRGTRRLAGALGGALGVGWALWLMPELDRVFDVVPAAFRLAGGAIIGAGLFGLGLVGSHLALQVDGLAARLQTIGTESGKRLHRIWLRAHRALACAPASARGEVLGLLNTNVREAERLAKVLVTLEGRLFAADRTEAESALAALKTDVVATTDAAARDSLRSAAASLSDSLEHLDALERKHERLGAELRLRLASLERAVLALESAQGEPGELKTLVLRLSAPA